MLREELPPYMLMQKKQMHSGMFSFGAFVMGLVMLGHCWQHERALQVTT